MLLTPSEVINTGLYDSDDEKIKEIKYEHERNIKIRHERSMGSKKENKKMDKVIEVSLIII